MARTKGERLKLSRDLEKIARGIEDMAKIGRTIQNSNLNFDAIVLLIHKASGVKTQSVSEVLTSLSELNIKYLKEEEAAL